MCGCGVGFNLYPNKHIGAAPNGLGAARWFLFIAVTEEGIPVLTYEDCVELSDLTEEEIEAIAEHEHLPEMAALELGSYLVHTEEGVPMIKRIILEDIETARQHGHPEKALKLKLVLKHFVETHPSAAGSA